MKDQLNISNTEFADQICQIEIFIELLRIMNQRQFGRRSEEALGIDGQLSLFDTFNEIETAQNPKTLK